MIRTFQPFNLPTTVDSVRDMGVETGPSQGENNVTRGRLSVVATSRSEAINNGTTHRERDDVTWVEPSRVIARSGNQNPDAPQSEPASLQADAVPASSPLRALLIGAGLMGLVIWLQYGGKTSR